MSTLVQSIRRRTLVVGLVVASFAVASGSAFAASAASPYGYAMHYTPKAQVKKVPESLYGYAMHYTPKAQVKIAQRPKVVVVRTGVRCDVSISTAHAGELARCE